ncbi:outer membrane beta-barrel protein [Pseudomonas baetica]|uniref:outer membrane beta-barrel protein n=1 Tax=Pseudomonas baetica TaxID=674054 RepID=UPI00240610FA|nr:outer membrane beta-barrel protein [Pseudomonas baetica]MDF9778651.1 opacity protein-like surface antigen [Pseudomonas baetica]
MLLRNLGFASLLSLLSFQALADDKGLYLGAGVSNIQTDESRLDDDDTSYKVYAGYRVNSYLAFEGAYVDLGQFKDENLDFEGKSAQAAAHVGFPLGDRLRVFGSVGAHAWDADGNATDDDTGVDLTYGVGLEVDVFRNIGLRAEYEVLEVGEINLNQTTASAYMLF